MQDEDARPAPEALLAEAAAERRGKLKVFLGAAPGVGKTYAMLEAGHARRRDGVDVVVGVVETHGRRETQAQLADLEVVPRRRVDYRGRVMEEMDLDAVLARRPQLVLVDELAHTNVHGSRHPKRYQDVRELIAAGIDVYTTVNIQHLESLNDVIAQITRIRVRETLPDNVLEAADQIELIDLTPEDLLKRLREGKVYLGDQASRAVRHFFSPGNLTALRELALRQAAARVDDQMVHYMRAHAISGPWPVGERLLVCVGPGPSSARLVRTAARIAERLHARWFAVHVETPGSEHPNDAARDRLADTLRLAEQLGADALSIPGADVAETLIAAAAERNVTRIVIGRSRRGRWRALWSGSPVQRLLRLAGPIEILVLPDLAAEKPAAPPRTERRAIDPRPYFWSALMVAGVTGAAHLAAGVGRNTNSTLSLVFIAAVIASALNFGLLPSLATAVLATLAFNVFFMPPLYAFTVADPANIVTLFVFLGVAVLLSGLAARSRLLTETARKREAAAAALYSFARKLAGVRALDDLLWAVAHQLAAMLKVKVVILLPDGVGSLSIRSGYPPDDRLTDAERAAAQWSWDHGRPAGRGADTLPGAERLFLPLRTASGPVAVIGIESEAPGRALSAETRRLVDALCDQAAVAIERVALIDELDEASVKARSEQLHALLFASISHDLRTPLASILAAATTLRRDHDRLAPPARDDLLATVEEEGERLNRFVGNLLDMTRLEAGALELRRDWTSMADVVATAIRRAGGMLGRHEVMIGIEPGLPPLRLDHALIEQVLINLLDNARKYSPETGRITVSVSRAGDFIETAVTDQGAGIPEAERDLIFDKFYRVRAGDRRVAGTGLGLAICKGFVEAHGGRIEALAAPDGTGTTIRFALPTGSSPPVPADG
ncbi:sensor histidine kinase KdpD [Zavarzinia compransoris]|uniref:sensor histidine kinase n=1 Tax=Zavarzinia marina TaxID=2911065 RepID=UPI001F446E83|nr:sensor histidine kinase KdpD [Zavarzinia marina]MCF4167721.1 sensor histidine kinase KdpD [Zavarzinia marina]